MRHCQFLTAAALTLGLAAALASSASAQPTSDVAVNVTFGPVLQKKQADYGVRELGDISRDLRESVQTALKHSRTTPPVRVDLVIEDAVPNRPTFEQLGRTISLSYRSVGLGGARVSGVATFADGAQRPIREQFFETDLHEERGVSTWYDADRAFDQLAYDVGKGRFRDKFEGPGPSGDGHFGYPFTN